MIVCICRTLPIILIEVVEQALRLPGSDACTSPTGIGFSDQHMFTTISGTNTVHGIYYSLICTVKSIRLRTYEEHIDSASFVFFDQHMFTTLKVLCTCSDEIQFELCTMNKSLTVCMHAAHKPKLLPTISIGKLQLFWPTHVYH